ncbi:hypothetical protein LGK95_17100 [Clostridium algoriphilum]|uniref:hypothetical protein n=1 Tax=Clostridium algoriphilum TaxID=198347 RepID=UPI001CF2E253|nr:hypothetical protein [Clostridium algoriphilum]MCB2295204.1 hypothetical protein [Clostridium algoriphilum]
MKIYVKLNNGRTLKIPAPLGLVKAAIRLCGFGLLVSRRFIPESHLQYIDCVDFKQLSRSIDVLRAYKGLKIVDVKVGDGPDVTIIM